MIDQIHEVTKQYTNEKPSATKLTQLRASSRMKRGYVHNNFSHKGKRIRPKCKLGFFLDCKREKKFSDGDTTNWSYKIKTTKESIFDTIPSLRIENLPERYFETLLKKSEKKQMNRMKKF